MNDLSSCSYCNPSESKLILLKSNNLVKKVCVLRAEVASTPNCG